MLPSDKDPLGKALWDYLTCGEAPDIVVKSDLGEDDYYDVPYYFRDESELPDWERTAMEHCKGRILDIGAGAGSHALILEQRGFDVLSIDISLSAVEVMKQRGVKNVKNIDVFDLEGETFDTLLMLMNGLGIVGDFEGLDRFLEYSKQLLRPQGQIIVDSSDISYLLEDDSYLLESLVHDHTLGEVQFQMIYKDICSDVFPWLYADFPTLRTYARKHGFTCELLAEGDHYEYVAKLEWNGGL